MPASSSAFQKPPGRADEGFSLAVLVIPRLLADEHEIGRGRALAKNRLSAALVQLTAAAVLGRLA